MKQLTADAALKKLQKCVKIDELSPAQARVLVAEDVLALLAIRKLDGNGGTYVRMNFDTRIEEGDLRKQMGHMESATVCGIGALFVAHVARFDKFAVEWSDVGLTATTYNQTTIHDHLRNVFPKGMLFKIEVAYESWEGSSRPGSYWAQKYATRPERMRAIMENIIRNKGTFVMRDVP